MPAADRFSLLILLLYGVFTSPAHAYLDPGTGSLVVQALIAGLAGSLLAIKMFWKNITGFVAGLVVRNKEKQ